MPPVLRRLSLTDGPLARGSGAGGDLAVLVRLADGRVAMYARLGSRADILLG